MLLESGSVSLEIYTIEKDAAHPFVACLYWKDCSGSNSHLYRSVEAAVAGYMEKISQADTSLVQGQCVH